MSAAKSKSKAGKDTSKELDLAGDDKSAAAKGGSKDKSKGHGHGDPTGQSHPIVNTGADALPNATRAAPQAQVPGFKKGESKEIYLDKVYTYHGRHYGPSAHPGDHVEVPADFPEHITEKEPSLKEWRPAPESAVIEIPDESSKVL